MIYNQEDLFSKIHIQEPIFAMIHNKEDPFLQNSHTRAHFGHES